MARRKRTRKRKRNRQTLVPRVLTRTQGSLWRAVMIATSVVVLINGIVRHVGGGDTHPLSLLRLPDKARAVASLAVHVLTHPLRSEEEDLEAVIAACAARNHVSPRLAVSVARAESSLKPHSISSTGAMGLMQLMPDTASSYGASDPFDAEQNAKAGTRLLKDLLDRYDGDQRRVLAAYNAGPGRVPRTGDYSLPDETRHYVAKILD